jgi:uncharacterized protein
VSFYFLDATAFIKLFVQEQGTGRLIQLLGSLEDNRKLIAASTPLEVHAAIRRRERAGAIAAEDVATALESLRLESARTVQQPLNPAVLEAARQLLDRSSLRWTECLQLGAAITAREMFQGAEIVFVATSASLLDAAKAEGMETLDPAQEPVAAE